MCALPQFVLFGLWLLLLRLLLLPLRPRCRGTEIAGRRRPRASASAFLESIVQCKGMQPPAMSLMPAGQSWP
jgi:hypothetical protein